MGPLHGIRIIELAGIGPGPFCGMMLADMGAEVIRVDRPGGNPNSEGSGHAILFRNRRTLALNLREKEGAEALLELVKGADAIFEGFRPGVAERLGVGPEACLAANPKIVYGRMTGWGQTGPLAKTAGHDINYIALSGALHAVGRRGEKPVPPLNLVGDFGGGGMMLAFGLVCGILEAKSSGKGQVIDTSMVEGSAALMAMFFSMHAGGTFRTVRGANLLDTGAPFYDTYETKDGGHVAIGPIEPQFYAILEEKLGIDKAAFGGQGSMNRWAEQKEGLAAIFRTKTRDEWTALFEGTDACVAPVLSIEEAPHHPHNVARESFLTIDGHVQPAPTPRFSRTAADVPKPAGKFGVDSREVLRDYGFTDARIDDLIAKKVVATS